MTDDTLIACNLDAADISDRSSEWNKLIAQAANYDRTKDGVKVTFLDEAQLKETAQDLVTREKECCPFFNFDFKDTQTGFTLTATAPPDAQFVFDEGGWSKLVKTS